jgi:chaperonin GroES
MLSLTNHITLDKETIEAPNLCHHFTEEDLRAIGEEVWHNYEADKQSREPWLRRTSAAMDLAMQVQKDKNFPWPGCSNIAFPLVTIAALQFHSRSYPALLNGPDVVQCRVIGPDQDGSKMARAERVSRYMSWQVLEQDCDWEEQQDRALLNVPIVGTAWKKSYFNAEKGYNDSDLVFAKDLVLNYWCKGTDDVTKTHILPFDRNKIYTRIMEGVFNDVRDCEWYKGDAPQPEQTAYSSEEDNRAGMNPPQVDGRTPFILLEQHCRLDLDGDGYEEPYIVTIEESCHTVLRIVCRFDREEDIDRNENGEIIRIRGTEMFTKIPFIPSPDGGIMDIGFGILLGPLNESVNGAINQLFDAGTMSNTAGGFLGRGAKIRGGVYNFSPFEWNRVDSTGDDLRKSIFPMPVREPSNVMFSLLSLLINYTEKVSGAVDISTGGNPGQNTPAQTSQTMVEQGQKVYAAIFKRIWRSLKEEFKKLYQLNGLHLPPNGINFAGSDQNISRGDFLGDPSAIIPVADPNIMSDQQKFLQASALMNVGRNNPLYNQDAINTQFLKALKINNIEQVYVGTKNAPPPQPDVKVQIENLKAQVQLKNLEWKKLQYISSLLEQRRLNEAKIVSLYAQAALFEKQAGGVEAGNQIAAFQALIDSIKMINEQMDNQVQQLGGANGDQGNTPGGTPEDSGAGGQGTLPGMEGPSSNGTPTGLPSPQA